MEVHFATKKLADALSQDRCRVRTYGTAVAKRIQVRLSQLASASDLETMRTLPGRCHELRQDRRGQLAIDVSDHLRLILTPTIDPPPTRDDGGLDWRAVTEVTILEVTDYHGD